MSKARQQAKEKAKAKAVLAGVKVSKHKSGGGKKIGRNKGKPACKRHLLEQRWKRNKLRKLRRHIRSFRMDHQAGRALERLLEAA